MDPKRMLMYQQQLDNTLLRPCAKTSWSVQKSIVELGKLRNSRLQFTLSYGGSDFYSHLTKQAINTYP